MCLKADMNKTIKMHLQPHHGVACILLVFITYLFKLIKHPPILLRGYIVFKYINSKEHMRILLQHDITLQYFLKWVFFLVRHEILVILVKRAG